MDRGVEHGLGAEETFTAQAITGSSTTISVSEGTEVGSL